MTRSPHDGAFRDMLGTPSRSILLSRRRVGGVLIALFVACAGTSSVNAAPATPPAGRAYELVSPLDKGGAEIERGHAAGSYATSGATASGDAVAYPALGQFAAIPSGAPFGQYRSERSATGWSTRALNPPVEANPGAELNSPFVWFLSEDLAQSVVMTNTLLAPEASRLGGSWGLYLQQSALSSASYRLISLPSEDLGTDPFRGLAASRFAFAGASDDMRSIVFDAQDRQLTPDAPETGRAVYQWLDGEIRFVSELPTGEPVAQPTAGAGGENGAFYPGDHLTSNDGQRVFFRDVVDQAVYVRENGATTRLVTSSERTGDDPAVPRLGLFVGAEASSGSKALISSVMRLTDDATACDLFCPTGRADDLYLWNADAPAGSRLTDLTTDDPNGGGVLGFPTVTDDLSRVFFVATGVLATGAEAGQANLYSWTAVDGVEYVATLSSELDGSVWSAARDTPAARYRDTRISDDGTRLLFTSYRSLTGVDTSGHKQVYLYDAVSKELSCVSCGEEAVTQDAWLHFPPDTALASRTPYRVPRNLSADGERVFFETRARMVDRDTNGKADVYMWSGGELTLISAGTGSGASEFIDASASGDDVFFATRDRLVGHDVDDFFDVYDARVGGGFPEPQVDAPCDGDMCQGPPAPPPVLPELASGAAPGGYILTPRPFLRVARMSAASRRALAHGRAASLAVRVNRSGRIVVRGTMRVGRKTMLVISEAKRARAAGEVRLRVRLSKAGRQQLARTGRLSVALSVRFSRIREPQTLALRLTRPINGRGIR